MSDYPIFEVTLETNGKETVLQMHKISGSELYKIPKGKTIVLILTDGGTWPGVFYGIDDDSIMLKSLNKGRVLGFDIDWLNTVLAECDSNEDKQKDKQL